MDSHANWMPAFVDMTLFLYTVKIDIRHTVIPAFAGMTVFFYTGKIEIQNIELPRKGATK